MLLLDVSVTESRSRWCWFCGGSGEPKKPRTELRDAGREGGREGGRDGGREKPPSIGKYGSELVCVNAGA